MLTSSHDPYRPESDLIHTASFLNSCNIPKTNFNVSEGGAE